MASLRGYSRLAQPQRLVFSYVYDLPFFKGEHGAIGRVLGGWQLAANTTFASGNPFTVLLGYDLNGDGIGGDRPFIVDPSILGRSVSNARIDPATGVQFRPGGAAASGILADGRPGSRETVALVSRHGPGRQSRP
jgi:hypothetical protein